MQFTERQIKVLKTPLRRINILEGAVRSGKTYFTCYIWGLHMLSMRSKYPNIKHEFIMVAKTMTSLKRNILNLMVDIWGEDVFSYNMGNKEARFDGILIHLEGVSDVRAEGKIRGMTLSGALCEELTLFTEDFFSMLLGRLSVTGAKLIGSTNPDHPKHWLKEKYINRSDELSLIDFKFGIDDNTTLDPEYVDNLKKEYTGVYYKRFIQGLWCNAEGLIYEDFANNKDKYIIDLPPKDDIAFVAIGVDFGGNKSATTFNTVGFTHGYKEAIILDEWYYVGNGLSPQQLDDNFVKYVQRNSIYPINMILCDSAETVLINGLKSALARAGMGYTMRNAIKGAISERIRFVTKLMSYDRFKIVNTCNHTIEAFDNAMWNNKAIELERLDDGTTNIDNLDSTEYCLEPYMKYMK